jgi:tRNA(Ile)-lysidine synthase
LTGLAISGGVDSMALATLCSNLHKQNLSKYSGITRARQEQDQQFEFRAFVVDHGVRKSSDIEALAVKAEVEKLGM